MFKQTQRNQFIKYKDLVSIQRLTTANHQKVPQVIDKMTYTNSILQTLQEQPSEVLRTHRKLPIQTTHSRENKSSSQSVHIQYALSERLMQRQKSVDQVGKKFENKILENNHLIWVKQRRAVQEILDHKDHLKSYIQENHSDRDSSNLLNRNPNFLQRQSHHQNMVYYNKLDIQPITNQYRLGRDRTLQPVKAISQKGILPEKQRLHCQHLIQNISNYYKDKKEKIDITPPHKYRSITYCPVIQYADETLDQLKVMYREQKNSNNHSKENLIWAPTAQKVQTPQKKQDFNEILYEVKNICKRVCSKRLTKVKKTILGKLQFMSRMKLSFEDVSEYRIFDRSAHKMQDSLDFFRATQMGDVEDVQYLLKYNPYLVYDLNQKCQTALHVAAKFNQLKVCQILVLNNCMIDAEDIVHHMINQIDSPHSSYGGTKKSTQQIGQIPTQVLGIAVEFRKQQLQKVHQNDETQYSIQRGEIGNEFT